MLEKYGLESHDSEYYEKRLDELDTEERPKFIQRLNSLEGKFSGKYFNQLFSLIPEEIRPEKRKKFKAYDGVNNLFNLAYEVLQWKVHRAIIKAKLEPYLGFLHSVQHAKPSLVCDLMEVYRYFVDDFVVEYCQSLTKRDFTSKGEAVSCNRKGRREYLRDAKTCEFMVLLDDFFDTIVDVPRLKHGDRQSITSLINEEAMILGNYLRDENKNWKPRTPSQY